LKCVLFFTRARDKHERFGAQNTEVWQSTESKHLS
jgi:hypothetical protein